MTNRKQAAALLFKLKENRGVSDSTLLDWILNNYLDGPQSVEALELFEMEYFDEVFEVDDWNDEIEYDDHYNDTFYDKEQDVELDD